MFINKTNIKLLAAALLTALAAPSCMNLDETREGGYGYLTISGLDLDVQVEQLVPTKAGESTMDISDLIGENRPELSEVTVTPEQPQEGEPAFYTWTISGGDLRLPAGKYTLSATSGSNDFGMPYFVGSGEVTVSALATAEGTVTFTLGNSVMKVTMADGFSSHFKPSSTNPVTISDGSASIRPAMNQYVFVPSSKSLTVTVTGNSSAEVGTVFTVTATPEAKTAYDVVLSATGVTLPTISLHSSQLAWGDRIFITNAATFEGNISEANKGKVVYEAIPASSSDWTNPSVAVDGVITGLSTGTLYKVRARVGALESNEITLTPAVTGLSASAAHTDTNGVAEGGGLDGTDVVATFTSPHDKVTEAISSWSFVVCKSTDENTALRTFNFAEGAVSGTVSSDGSALTGTTDWPYLPQGNYTLIATATLKNGTKVSSKAAITVPAPTFGVSVSANTTYSYYTKQGASVANGKVAETIYDIASSVGISQNILDNTNYSKPVVTYSVGSTHSSGEKEYTALNSHSLGSNFEGLAWGTHDLKASIKFDNTTVSGTCVCYITGLPYRSPDLTKQAPLFTSSNEVNKWISNGTTEFWKERGYQIYKYYYYVFGTEKKSGNLFSPALQIPNNVELPITYTAGINYFSSIHAANATMSIFTGATTSQQKVQTTVSPGTYLTNSITRITGSDKASKNTRISISHNEAKLNSNAAENWVLVTFLNIDYSD